jgi:hypothetical protein
MAKRFNRENGGFHRMKDIVSPDTWKCQSGGVRGTKVLGSTASCAYKQCGHLLRFSTDLEETKHANLHWSKASIEQGVSTHEKAL